MIIKVDSKIKQKDMEKILERIEEYGLEAHISHGSEYTILGLVGDTSVVDIDRFLSIDYVLDAQRVKEPYKRASRKFKPEDTIVKVGDVEIGGNNLVMMAGPCSVESEEQIMETARVVKKVFSFS